MNEPRRVLVATQDPGFACSMVAWLTTAGFEVTLVTSFAAAKAQLLMHPELVIADVKLGAYNGLQVAARAHALGIGAIVMGPSDRVLQRDAGDLGAIYLETELGESSLLATAHRLLRTNTRTQDPPVADDLEGTTDDRDVEWPFWPESGAGARASSGSKRALIH